MSIFRALASSGTSRTRWMDKMPFFISAPLTTIYSPEAIGATKITLGDSTMKEGDVFVFSDGGFGSGNSQLALLERDIDLFDTKASGRDFDVEIVLVSAVDVVWRIVALFDLVDAIFQGGKHSLKRARHTGILKRGKLLHGCDLS